MYTEQNLARLNDEQLSALASLEQKKYDMTKVEGRGNKIQAILGEQNIANTLSVYKRRVLGQ